VTDVAPQSLRVGDLICFPLLIR